MARKKLSSKEAKRLSKLGSSKGGRARANVLTPDERKEIARKAVQARWAKARSEQVEASADRQGKADPHPGMPIALFPGKLTIGDGEFGCYVLDNGKRVLSQREVVRALTGLVKGDLSRYLNARNLTPYIDERTVSPQTIQFRISGNPVTANGYEATLLLDICDAYLRAREEGALGANQLHIARQAEIITRACAKIGIIALIDEATGFQKFRKKRDLQLKLQAFIADDLQEWAKLFPDEFWIELARLEGIRYSPRSRPLRWGRYIMMFVYDAVDKDVGAQLRKKNPNPHFLKNHHQWLKKFGRDQVHDQIERVITIMKLCDDMNDFREKFKRVFKKKELQPQISFDWEPRGS